MSLKCENIVKTYNKTDVLKNINLEITQGKIYGLIGRNGAGKTTLLSIITAQNTATSGSITYDGAPVWENQAALDHICFSRELNPVTTMGPNNMKAKEYLRIASIFYPNWDEQLARRLIELFHLDTRKRISKMSKGMLSMVTIIIALASKADYTFLDEPVAGLDVVMREYFYQVLLDEFTNSGRTFVISTHIIEEASDIFEEVVMLDKGKIILKENTQELLERSYHISGKIEAVDEFTKGLKTFHEEKMGRSKGVMVLVEPGKELIGSADVTVQPINLQQIFVAMCGREAVQS